MNQYAKLISYSLQDEGEAEDDEANQWETKALLKPEDQLNLTEAVSINIGQTSPNLKSLLEGLDEVLAKKI
jgi:hypothetical protein